MPVTESNTYHEDPKLSNTSAAGQTGQTVSISSVPGHEEDSLNRLDSDKSTYTENYSGTLANNQSQNITPIQSAREPDLSKGSIVNRSDGSIIHPIADKEPLRHSLRIQRKPSYRNTLSKTSASQSSKYSFDHFSFQPSLNNRLPKLINSYLKPNAKFIGEQQSGKARYHIKVEFKTVDIINSIVTGFLQISGLTEDHPEITTCFKGEIINNPLNKFGWQTSSKRSMNDISIKNYSFITENRKWGSFMKNDLDHWKKLTSSYSLTESQLKQKLQKIQSGEEDNQFIYMRWKEEFLLPDSRVKQINGASFEGFYYIVLNIGGYENSNSNVYSSNIIPGSISGLYYHKSSEKFQSLSLRFVEDHGISNTFEFL